jgi:hypothetical protein
MTTVTQLCYATRDIEATARDLAKVDRIGPFYFAEFPQSNLVLNGQAVSYDPIKVAFGYRESLQYEVIEAPAGVESCYSMVLDGRREALHHSYISMDEDFDDIVARHASAGEAMIYHGIAGENIRFGYVDARRRLGHFVELLETRKMVGSAGIMLEMYAKMEAEARSWQGERPLRRLEELF